MNEKDSAYHEQQCKWYRVEVAHIESRVGPRIILFGL